MLKLEIYVDGDELASFAPTVKSAVGAVELAGFTVRSSSLAVLNPNGDGVAELQNFTPRQPDPIPEPVVVEVVKPKVVPLTVGVMEVVKEEVVEEVEFAKAIALPEPEDE